MKKKYFLFLFLFIVVAGHFSKIFAQYGGGTGTGQDPYQIYTLQHIEELNDSINTYFNILTNSYYLTGVHFRLMNDIQDTISFKIGLNGQFNGIFNGANHSINININQSYGGYNSLFVYVSGIVDSLILFGNNYAWGGICEQNYGTISNCINNIPLIGDDNNLTSGFCSTNYGLIKNCINNASAQAVLVSPICFANYGNLENCVNNGNINIMLSGVMNSAQCGGICFHSVDNYLNTTSIINCINNGNITIIGIPIYTYIGGISSIFSSDTIKNCINNGNIDGKSAECCAGISAVLIGSMLNCENTGSIIGGYAVGGLVGILEYSGEIANCFNSGSLNGFVNEGGLIGSFGSGSYITTDALIRNNLNIGKINMLSLFGDTINTFFSNPNIIFSNNYYDKQMVTKPATVIGDISGQAEGKLTTQLTGTSAELQAMLGNGWSYAEGRYPIPLGLENDSATILAATPMYLHFTDTVNFNTVDSVSQDFTVGMENNVAWQVAGNKVILQNENAILQSIGNEQLTVSRGTYSKNISIHIVQAPEIQTFTISGYITSNSSPLENVIVNYSGGSTTTNNFGFYQFQTNEHSNQTITPSLTGYIFEPQQITLTDIQQNYPNQNFTANLVSLDSENFTNISVYPNPAKDEINISGIENPQVIISDLSGRIILTTNSSKININNLSEGMYFLQVDNKMIKIVKK